MKNAVLALCLAGVASSASAWQQEVITPIDPLPESMLTVCHTNVPANHRVIVTYLGSGYGETWSYPLNPSYSCEVFAEGFITADITIVDINDVYNPGRHSNTGTGTVGTKLNGQTRFDGIPGYNIDTNLDNDTVTYTTRKF